MRLNNYIPRSKLQVKTTYVQKPRFPLIDAHNHINAIFNNSEGISPQEILDDMDEADVDICVDLDGGWGEDILQNHLDTYKANAPERFIHFGGVDWSQWFDKTRDFGEWAAKRLNEQVRWGAQGLKIWKNLGLKVHDHEMNLVPIDDPRLDPLWGTAGAL